MELPHAAFRSQSGWASLCMRSPLLYKSLYTNVNTSNHGTLALTPPGRPRPGRRPLHHRPRRGQCPRRSRPSTPSTAPAFQRAPSQATRAGAYHLHELVALAQLADDDRLALRDRAVGADELAVLAHRVDLVQRKLVLRVRVCERLSAVGMNEAVLGTAPEGSRVRRTSGPR
jgi:hypothetical protein